MLSNLEGEGGSSDKKKRQKAAFKMWFSFIICRKTFSILPHLRF